jgi:hypothetical protein
MFVTNALAYSCQTVNDEKNVYGFDAGAGNSIALDLAEVTLGGRRVVRKGLGTIL